MSILTTQDRLDALNEDIEISKSLKISLMKVINNPKHTQENRDLAILLLEKERQYEQQCLAQRRKTQKTICSGGDIRPRELFGNYEAKV